jgi:hypothetical protein
MISLWSCTSARILSSASAVASFGAAEAVAHGLRRGRSPSHQSLSAQKQKRPEISFSSLLLIAAALCAQKRVILCAVAPEHNAPEIANARRPGRAERFVAAFLSTTKVC